METIPILTGPTAVGKSRLSLDLAQQLGAEIVSADSRQVYRELTIGTAKPSADELAAVPHHFINERSLGEPFSAGQFHQAAYERIDEILARGRVPLVVGGSTLYIHALKEGLADIPGVPQEIRDDLQGQLEQVGGEALYERLRAVDPKSAESMDPTKTQRLIRALEVYEATGRTLTSFHDEQTPPPYEFTTVVLHRDRRRLYDRINERVDRMIERGLVDEVEAILEAGFDLSVNPMRTIGYQEPIAYLRGDIPHDEMLRLIQRNTRRYAKRQLTWFRRDARNVWIEADQPMQQLEAAVRTAFTRTSEK